MITLELCESINESYLLRLNIWEHRRDRLSRRETTSIHKRDFTVDKSRSHLSIGLASFDAIELRKMYCDCKAEGLDMPICSQVERGTIKRSGATIANLLLNG